MEFDKSHLGFDSVFSERFIEEQIANLAVGPLLRLVEREIAVYQLELPAEFIEDSLLVRFKVESP
ncbi:MAG: hypothetical protein DMF76_13540 [Acidobacteria bacterium]|nr:MAG: hypothetical protein DMF76_13540 [Acidobacteriota bacterium]